MPRLPYLLIPALFAPLLSVAADEADAPKSYAVIVGVADYAHASFGKLACTENDAEKLAEVLDRKGSPFEGRVRVLTCARGRKKAADRPTAANIRAAVKAMCKGRRVGETVLVALAGHGMELSVSDPKGAEKAKTFAMFCPQDVELSGTNFVTGHNDHLVNLEHLLDELGDCGADRRIVLVDACREEVSARKATRSMKIDRRMLPPKTAMLLACQSGERSFESKEKLGHGVFFHYVIEGLKGAEGATDAAGAVTWNRLSAYVQEQVEANVGKIVGGGATQAPADFRSDFRNVVVVPRTGPAPGEEREAEIAAGVKVTFCWIPAGSAKLGSPPAERDAARKQNGDKIEFEWLKAESEERRGTFATKGFWLAKTECTQRQWEKVTGENPSRFTGKDALLRGKDTSDFPVDNVSWDDIRRPDGFLNKVNKRAGATKALGKGTFALPHEDEWEYACRGGKKDKTAFAWGDALNGGKANCNGKMPFGTETKGSAIDRTAKVGSYAKEAPHPWGLVDMHGNVWEWCDNMYSRGAPFRVQRGGSCLAYAVKCRAAFRNDGLPEDRTADVGFRLMFRPE